MNSWEVYGATKAKLKAQAMLSADMDNRPEMTREDSRALYRLVEAHWNGGNPYHDGWVHCGCAEAQAIRDFRARFR